MLLNKQILPDNPQKLVIKQFKNCERVYAWNIEVGYQSYGISKISIHFDATKHDCEIILEYAETFQPLVVATKSYKFTHYRIVDDWMEFNNPII
jgi:hypothetical protein